MQKIKSFLVVAGALCLSFFMQASAFAQTTGGGDDDFDYAALANGGKTTIITALQAYAPVILSVMVLVAVVWALIRKVKSAAKSS